MQDIDTRSHDCVFVIDDADDIRLAPYRDIREKDLVGRQQRFIAEGKVVLNVLFPLPHVLKRNPCSYWKTGWED